MPNVCAINGDNHKYFVFKTMVEFVPYQGPYDGLPIDAADSSKGDLYRNLYQRVEYAYLGCNCGSSVKSKVKELQYGEE